MSVMMRVALITPYVTAARPGAMYDENLANAKQVGIGRYLAIRNFVHVSTDGPYNPYSKVYDRGEIERNFPDFELVEMHREFMHAPPLPVSWLPLTSLLGWHLWATMRPKK